MDNNQEITLKSLIAGLRAVLDPVLGGRESSATVDFIFECLKGWNKTDLILRSDHTVSDYLADKARTAAARVAAGEPVQYVFSRARFYGMDFKVTPDVLIPRPETAILIDEIVDENSSRQDLRVLDLGTGSGCIAIALSRNLPFSQVTAVDFSPGALTVAHDNAATLHARVKFVRADMLNDRFDSPWNIIVSNPPYVLESEKASMEANVLDYEPHSALFVPDSDPLRYYRAIARIAASGLAPEGRLYLEINPLCADSLDATLKSEGFTDIRFSKDLDNRRRFIRASL